jgi:ribonucleotide reductase beta subunit family protein with ferritin-like domain
VDKNYLIKSGPQRRRHYSAYANDKANTVLGWSPVFSEEAMASAWKWEQKVRKQNNNNEKCFLSLILIV